MLKFSLLLAFPLFFLSSLQAQLREEFEGGDRNLLAQNCWEFAAVSVHRSAGFNSSYGIRSGSTVNHNPAAGLPHFFRTPYQNFNGDPTQVTFSHRVDQNKVAQIQVYLQLPDGSQNLVGQVNPKVTWGNAAFSFSYAGPARLEFQFYSTPGGNPSGSHRLLLDNLSISNGGMAGCPFVANSTFPVEWVSMDVSERQQGALLRWTTTNEVNHSHFVVERSLDGVSFSPVGEVRQGKTSGALHQYEYLNRGLATGETWHYRIQQVDLDGQYEYSQVLSLRVSGQFDGRYEVFNLQGHRVFVGYPEDFYPVAQPGQLYFMRGAGETRKVMVGR